MEMLYHSVSDLVRLANEHQIPLWKVVLLADVQERQVTVEESFETMRQMYQAMRQADQEYDGSIVSASGMAGGDGEKLHAYNASGRSLAGEYMGLVMEKAVKMGESNACMKRIVAAPTAGACGVIPAVFLSYEEYCNETENRMVEALLQESVRLLQKMRASPVHRVDARRRLVQQVRWQQGGWHICRAAIRSVSRMQRHLPSKICWD